VIALALAQRVRGFIHNDAQLSLKEPGDDLDGVAGHLTVSDTV
jgi:hypothetical protein